MMIEQEKKGSKNQFFQKQKVLGIYCNIAKTFLFGKKKTIVDMMVDFKTV
jgi:hypothetical protein